MLEAVNSVVSNAPLLRAQTGATDVARSFAANPGRIQEIPQAPFVSPYIHLDVNYDKAVLQIRDGETGDVTRQFPSEQRLQEVRAQQRRIQTQNLQPSESRSEPAPAQGDSGQSAGPTFVSSPEPQVSDVHVHEAQAPTQQQIAAYASGAQTAAPQSGGAVSDNA